MTNVILKCNSCGAILVVNTTELWKIKRCPTCESGNIENMDDKFSFSDIAGDWVVEDK